MNTALRLIAVATLGIAQGQDLTREQALTQHYAAEMRRQSTPLCLPTIQSWTDRIGNRLAAGFESGIDWSFELTADASATEPIAKVEILSSGQFDQIQEMVRATPEPARRPPTLHRK